MIRDCSLPLKSACFRRFFHVGVFIWICCCYLGWGKLWGKIITISQSFNALGAFRYLYSLIIIFSAG